MLKYLRLGEAPKENTLQNYRYGFIDALKVITLFSAVLYIIWS